MESSNILTSLPVSVLFETLTSYNIIPTFQNQFVDSVAQNSGHPHGNHYIDELKMYYDDDDDNMMMITMMTTTMMMMDITVLAILMVGMGIIPLRAYYYPAESQIESPPDIQHAGD